MIAASIFNKRALVVAGCAERAIREIHGRKDAVCRPAWILDTQPPGAVTAPSRHIHVTTKLNHEIAEAPFAQNVAGSIHRITFCDTAEVRNHSLATQKSRAGLFVHLEVEVVDEWQPSHHFTMIRNGAVLVLIIELPETRQHAKRHVEFSVGPLAYLTRSPQDFTKLRSSRNGMFSGGRIQALNIAALAPIAH